MNPRKFRHLPNSAPTHGAATARSAYRLCRESGPEKTASRCLTSIAALLIVCGCCSHAQYIDRHFEHLTVDQGLSFSEVTCIIQDSRGFMWFGTGGGGLNMYDGYTFTQFRPDPLDSTSMVSSYINTLTEDRHGDIWVNCAAALARFDRVTGKITRCLTDSWVTSSNEDTSADVSPNGMWFTTLGKGIFHFDRTAMSFKQYVHDPNDSSSVSSDSSFFTFADRKGTLWIGTTRGLNSLDKSRSGFTHYDSGPKNQVYTMHEAHSQSDEVLWIGADDGLYSYDRTTGSFLLYLNPFARVPSDNSVRTLYIDRTGRLWVGTKGGIAGFDRSTRRFVSYQGGIDVNTWGFVNKAWAFSEDKMGMMWTVSHWGALRKFNDVRNEWIPVEVPSDHEVLFHALCMDNSGTMWFGTVADAVLKLDRARKPFNVYTKIPGDTSSLTSATVTGICEDESGILWVGTLLGLNELDPRTGSFTHYRHNSKDPHSLSHDAIWPILGDNRRALWIGTQGGGLDRFDKTHHRFIHHRTDPQNALTIASDDVNSLCQSQDGNLWMGTGRVIAEYSPDANTFRRHSPPYSKSIAGSEVRAILEDRNGLIWIANPGAGLNSFDRRKEIWTHYVPHNGQASIGDGGIRSLCEDREGTLWVGADGGLLQFNRQTGTFDHFGTKEGLADGFVNAILEDGKGNLWLCTASGLSKFDPHHHSFRNFDAADGFDIGTCRLPTGYRNRKGEIFFGGNKGFVRFHPDSIRDNPFVPPIILTGLRKLDRPVQLDTAISEKHMLELSYRDNVISLEFAALNFTSSRKNQYAYKLEGFDTGWVYCGTRRSATYTNLDGGDYTFRVKGCNNDGIWNEQGAALAITITPPWWKMWWFRGLAFITMLVSVGGSVRYVEMKKLKRKIELLEQEHALERERTRISQDMHDEVGASLTEIAILSELAKKSLDKPGETATHIQQISDRAAEVIDNIGEIIWAINPKNDSLDDVVAHIRHHTVQYLKMTPMKCTFVVSEGIPSFRLSAEVRRNLFLVAKEAIHNIVKHSCACDVSVSVTFTRGKLQVLIEDNGKGFTVGERVESGNGLVNMEKRIADIGGTFAITSGLHEGTQVAIEVPISPMR
jgi:signal transduction histidine kinase/ligand-binding sensor domain-containing protein